MTIAETTNTLPRRWGGTLLRAVGAGVVSALLLIAAFPAFNVWPLAWIALVPIYVFLVRESRPWRAFLSFWIFGVVLHLIGAYWMYQLGTVPWAMLALIEGIPFGLQALFCCAVGPRLSTAARPLVFAAVWVTGEWFRSCGRLAFPWFLLASSQTHAPLAMLQVLSLTGQWGLTFAIAIANALIGEAYLVHTGKRGERRALFFVGGAVAIPLLLVIGGAVPLRQLAAEEARAAQNSTLTITAAQGNLPKIDLFNSEAELKEYQASTMATYSDLTRQSAESVEKPDLIVWPEGVAPGYLPHNPQLLAQSIALSRLTATPLLIGTLDIDPTEPNMRNSALLLDPVSMEYLRYDKMQIVPLGEYFPLRGILGSIYKQYGVSDRDDIPGTLPGVMPIPRRSANNRADTVKVGVMICYDDVFTWQARPRVLQGAQLLILMTSDDTFGDTIAGPQQHADLDVLRTIETDRYLVRAAATGPSEVVRPDGGIEALLPADRRGVLQRRVPLLSGETLFVRWGDYFAWGCTGALVALCVWLVVGRKGASASA